MRKSFRDNITPIKDVIMALMLKIIKNLSSRWLVCVDFSRDCASIASSPPWDVWLSIMSLRLPMPSGGSEPIINIFHKT